MLYKRSWSYLLILFLAACSASDRPSPKDEPKVKLPKLVISFDSNKWTITEEKKEVELTSVDFALKGSGELLKASLQISPIRFSETEYLEDVTGRLRGKYSKIKIGPPTARLYGEHKLLCSKNEILAKNKVPLTIDTCVVSQSVSSALFILSGPSELYELHQNEFVELIKAISFIE